MSSNTVTVIGNATRDPELRYTTGGQGVASFGLACSRRWKNKQDEWQEQTSFFNVVAWGELGENVAASITKGARVIVAGRLEQRSWETNDGEKRSVVEVIADEIGPSLRWATAEVARTERSDGGGGYDSGPSGGGGGTSSPLPDEEPFVRDAGIGDV